MKTQLEIEALLDSKFSHKKEELRPSAPGVRKLFEPISAKSERDTLMIALPGTNLAESKRHLAENGISSIHSLQFFSSSKKFSEVSDADA